MPSTPWPSRSPRWRASWRRPASSRRVTTGSVSRRRFLGGAGALAAGAAVGSVVVDAPAADAAIRAGGEAPVTVPFHGAHQAGIVTPAQDRLLMAAFDVSSTDRAEVVALLKKW